MKANAFCILLSVTFAANPVQSLVWDTIGDLYNGVTGVLFGGSMEPELGMTVPEIIEYYGYPVEVHHVVTKDGYILTVHRIPHGKNGPGAQPREPALLLHGLVSSSAVWVWNTLNGSLGFQLADRGYDVWMANLRGNEYSLNHTSLSPDSRQFWDFSWDEMAKYDVPDTTDYVLDAIGFKQLWLIGYSMGTTLAFATLSSKPEYNAKVKYLTALAPATIISHMKSPIRLLAPLSKPGGAMLAALANGKFKMDSALTDFVVKEGCTVPLVNLVICKNVVSALLGPEYGQFNKSRLNFFLTILPTSTSVRTVTQYGMNVYAKKFNYFDFGPKKNLIKYKQANPPEYNISKITAPVALFWSEEDWIAPPVDVAEIPPKLPNLVLNYKVKYQKFSHPDFIWGKDVKSLVYDYVLESYEKFH